MLRFTIIDYTTDPLGVSTEIEEPVGWDAIKLRMKRDKTWHGFFNFADDSLGSLQFVNDGRDILKTAYEATGTSSNVELLVEYQCAPLDDYQQLYNGRFVFSTFKDYCGDECYCEISLEALNCLMQFRNRYDQQVDLDSLVPFDISCNCGDSVIAGGRFITTVPNKLSIINLADGYTPADILCLNVGDEFTVSGSTSGNDGTYTVQSAILQGAAFIITIEETFPGSSGLDEFTIAGCLFAEKLTEYAALNQEVTLPSKVIFLQSIAGSTAVQNVFAIQNPTDLTYPTGYLPDGGGGYLTGTREGWFTVPSQVSQSDLSTMNGSITEYSPSGVDINDYPAPVFTLDNLPICPAFRVRVQISFTGTFTNTGSSNRSEELIIVVAVGETPITAQGASIINNTTLYSYTGTSPDTQNFTYALDESITVAAGQSIFYYFFYSGFKSDSPQNDPVVTINNDFRIDLSSDSECDSTESGIYLINETLSRCVESYTGDCMRVYSDYFGRTDAEPYPSDADGCGGLRSIVNGLRIRNAPNSESGTPQKVTVSMKDMFDALNATDNIGMGLEVDPNRGPYITDYYLIRVEPQEYFFNDTVLMECDHIRNVTREVDSQLIFSTIKGGFLKWKTWNINGLNDVFTPREYRTELSELKNELDITCKFLASDYAIEWTRRQYGLTTADSRYDNDIFFICLTRDPYEYEVVGLFIDFIQTIKINGIGYQFKVGDTVSITGSTSNDGTYTITFIEQSIPGLTTSLVVAETIVNESGPFTITNTNAPFAVEQGVDSPANILNPDTVYNYRLAPSRNTMRWMKSILQSYRAFISKKVLFTSGEGNILATGQTVEPCRIEDGVIAENQYLTLDNFADPESNYPLFWPELVSFEYPMSYDQYLTIVANPYGLIGFQCGNNDMQYGWIEDMQYSPYNGMANFVLRPKIES